MNQNENTISCPHCDYENFLDEANFCGGCGVDLTAIKQQHYQQQFYKHQIYNQQQQFNQHNQFTQHQQLSQQQQYYQQQYYQYQQYYNQYPQPQVAKKKNVLLTIFRVLLLISIIVSSIILVSVKLMENDSKFMNGIDESLFYNFFVPNDDKSETPYYSAGGVSSEEYAKLKNGMSYALTSYIIGGDGILVNTGENIQNKFYYTYSWSSEIDENIVYFITFVDDAISEIMIDQS